MQQLHQRLKRCREVGGLTLADMSLWLETPRETVKGWLLGLHYPMPALRQEVFRKLEDIELAMEEAGGLIIPTHVRQRGRTEYLRGLLDARRNQVPATDNS